MAGEERYRVWDLINGDEESAKEIWARSPCGAAERYAEEDYDGHTDGLYELGQPIMVLDPSGNRHRFSVSGEITIEYHACLEEVRPPVPTKIVRILETCFACPSQWSGWDEYGNHFYFRFRWGALSVTAEYPGEQTLVYRQKLSDGLDGCLTYEALKEALAGILELPDACSAEGARDE